MLLCVTDLSHDNVAIGQNPAGAKHISADEPGGEGACRRASAGPARDPLEQERFSQYTVFLYVEVLSGDAVMLTELLGVRTKVMVDGLLEWSARALYWLKLLADAY